MRKGVKVTALLLGAVLSSVQAKRIEKMGKV